MSNYIRTEDVYTLRGEDFAHRFPGSFDPDTLEVKASYTKNFDRQPSVDFDVVVDDTFIEISLPAETTIALKPGRYYYTVIIKDPSGARGFREGIFYVNPSAVTETFD